MAEIFDTVLHSDIWQRIVLNKLELIIILVDFINN